VSRLAPIVLFTPSRAWVDYTVSGIGPFTIADSRVGSPDGTDTVSNIENFQFANVTATAAELLNDEATNIALSTSTVAENSSNGTVVGSLSDTDADALLGDTAAYTLTNDAGGRFVTSGTSWLTTVDQAVESDRPQLGGKAVSLGCLIRLGYAVPRSFVISTERTNEILRLKGILETLDRRPALEVSKKLRAWISDLRLPTSLLDEIAQKTQTWGRYCIRSSAVNEDGETNAWPGVLESRIDIAFNEIEDSIRQCLASIFSLASLKYAASRSLSPKDLAMAIIVQEFVRGQVSGVAFSIDPVNHSTNAIIIEAASAPASRVTDGSLTPDHYTIEKLTGRILDLRKGQSDGYALSKGAAIKIAHHVTDLERGFGYPVDVEWTIKDGVFVPLQSRRVTSIRSSDAIVTQAPQAYRFWWRDYDAWWQFEAGIRSFETEMDVVANQMTDVVYEREGGSTRCLISVDDVMRLSEIGFALRTTAQFKRFEVDCNDCLNIVHETLRELNKLAADQLTAADICRHLVAIDAAYRRCVALYRACDPYATKVIFDSLSQFIPTAALMDLIVPSDPSRAQEAEDWGFLVAQQFDVGLAWNHVRSYPWLVPNFYSRDSILATLHQKHGATRGDGGRRIAGSRTDFAEVALPDSEQESLRILRGMSNLRLRLKLAFTSFDFHFVELYEAICRITGVSARDLHGHYSIIDMVNLLSNNLRPVTATVAIGHFRDGRLTFVNAEHSDAFWKSRCISLDDDETAEIRGTVANHGEITGRVHLLSCNDTEKANQIRQRMHNGDVLVSEMIQFNVMDLVQRAGGLITDEGGVLSHAAILAREMGIPCIVGTQRATLILKDGDQVRIDTRDGSVRRVNPSELSNFREQPELDQPGQSRSQAELMPEKANHRSRLLGPRR
jgi:rifampicin phosphotransferase